MSSQLTSKLIVAAKDGNQERCQRLLSQGADVNGTSVVSKEDEQIGCNVEIAHMTCIRVVHRISFCYLNWETIIFTLYVCLWIYIWTSSFLVIDNQQLAVQKNKLIFSACVCRYNSLSRFLLYKIWDSYIWLCLYSSMLCLYLKI